MLLAPDLALDVACAPVLTKLLVFDIENVHVNEICNKITKTKSVGTMLTVIYCSSTNESE